MKHTQIPEPDEEYGQPEPAQPAVAYEDGGADQEQSIGQDFRRGGTSRPRCDFW